MTMVARASAAIVAMALLAACATTAAPTPTTTPTMASAVPSYLLNPAVTPTTIMRTICVTGWTATIRPPAAYTTALKIEQLAAEHAADQNPADYEEDHLVPLELGGAPREPRNLWPQPWSDARTKDRQENALRADVCAGRMSLAAARLAMWRWPRPIVVRVP